MWSSRACASRADARFRSKKEEGEGDGTVTSSAGTAPGGVASALPLARRP
jgi:hypothetical protein